jgi:hypothetical protein
VTVAEQPFTEDDVRLLADELEVLHAGPASFREDARSVLEFLAAHSKLLPPGARVVGEIGVRVDREHPRRMEEVGTVMTHFHRETALRAPEVWDGWSLVRRAAIKWAGPWVPVSEEGIPE